MPKYVNPAQPVQDLVPRALIPNPSQGRPSINLGSIHNSQHLFTTVNLHDAIVPSSPVPFSQIATPKPTNAKFKRPTGKTQQVANLHGPNAKIPASIPPGLTNNPNFQKLVLQISNTRSAFTRTRVVTALQGAINGSK